MDRWVLKPLISIGNIKFGMDREEVHRLFDEKCQDFKKSKFSQNTADDYGKFHVFYTSENTVKAVEIFEDIEVELDGEIVFPIKTCQIEKVLAGITAEDGSYTSVEKSIGIYAPEEEAESILAASEGYYA